MSNHCWYENKRRLERKQMSRTGSEGLEGSAEERPSEYSHRPIDPKDNTKSCMCKEFVNISFHDFRRTLRLTLKLKKPHSYLVFAKPQICLVPLLSSFNVTLSTSLFTTYLTESHEQYGSLLSLITFFGLR